MTDSQTHLVFVALADPTRRLLFEQLCQEGSGTATSFAARLPITRQAVTKHLTILVEAGLVVVHEAGRERRYMPHPEALQSVTTWIATIEARWDHRLAALRSYLLDEPRTPSTPEEENVTMASQWEKGGIGMKPKPGHLGLKYAEQFKDSSIAEAYHHRPPYADEAIRKLVELITDEPRTVLDVGCGTGDLARRLAGQVERVDAVDFSQAMLNEGRALSNGDHPHLRWIYGRVEEIELQLPYALITAGESLHWMEWDVVMPLFHCILTPHGLLAIVERGHEPASWNEGLGALIQRFSTNKEYRPYDLVEELEERHLFQKQGSFRTSPTVFVQSIDDYIHSLHSRNGLSRERMDKAAAQAFDAEVRGLLTPFLQDDGLALTVFNEVVWGNPLANA